mmetsp:Transcript_15928/g.30312  ORF Transcript_15928/g.30312 Transcript_15928/m.30312 type:complete len:1173 (-) Transcript_15928:79-3597(-)
MSSLLAKTVHLIVTAATLLSGDLNECLTPLDSSCHAGVAAVDAWARNLTIPNDPYLVLPTFDKSSPFVQMHPLGWSVNRLVLQHIMGWRTFLSTPALLIQHKEDYEISSRDLSDLQSTELPFLLSNVDIPPSNSWSPYTYPVLFDQETGLAVLAIVNSNQPLNYPQIEATLGILDHVERVNALSGCATDNTSVASLFDQYVNRSITERQCWIPVVVYADTKENFLDWLGPVINYKHRPALVVNIEEEIEGYTQPTRTGEHGVWVVAYENENDVHVQLPIEIAEGGRDITNVGLVTRDMGVLPNEVSDSVYIAHQEALRALANEAESNDPIVGQSVAVPAQRDGSYRRCKAGECEAGNLFNDAIRWYTDADIAFQNSGGFRGPGWVQGDVRVSDVWGAMPFDNTLCKGVISGVSLFKLFNYSVTYSTFQGENTQLGDRLLQVSGLRVSYNLDLPNTTRLVAIEVWDKSSQAFKNLERLELYSFVTDSYMCSGFVDYPELLGPETLVLEGEVPGEIGDAVIVQTVVVDYLLQLDGFYDPRIPGNRLVNRTDIMEPLNLIQTADSCQPGEYWQEAVFTCSPCPTQATVTFLSEQIEFEGDDLTETKATRLVNTALYGVAVLVKSKPAWVSITSAVFDNSGLEVDLSEGAPSVAMGYGETLIISFAVDMARLEPGTAQGTVAFGVLDGGNLPGCSGRDTAFEVFARKYPPEDLNQLGSIRYVGWGLAGIAVIMALSSSAWVFYYRQSQIVRTLQPAFLVTISAGVLVMALALIPLGIDDELVSENWCDISCMSIPWLLSLGFTAAMSALFSKLWRINRLFKAAFRRVNLKIQNVMAPFLVMFSLNCASLLVWTLVSPLRWQRIDINGEPWNSYGTCRSNNETVGMIMLVIVTTVNAVCLFFACYTAYVARDISDEFAESKSVGLALFCWVQVILVAGPMLFLIDSDNVAARFFLQAGVIFAVSVSMLCFIFGPVFWQRKRAVAAATAQRMDRASRDSQPGLSTHRASNVKFSLRDRGVRVSGLDPISDRSNPLRSFPSKHLTKGFHDYDESDEDDYHDEKEMRHRNADSFVSNSSSWMMINESHPDATSGHLDRVDELDEPSIADDVLTATEKETPVKGIRTNLEESSVDEEDFLMAISRRLKATQAHRSIESDESPGDTECSSGERQQSVPTNET